MHHYRKNIGDYHKKAGRLSLLQHGVYNLLLDSCYDRECFPTVDEAIDWVWASSDDEIKAVKFVLNKFFKEDELGRFVQPRISDEIEKYQAWCMANAKNGKLGGRPLGSKNKQQKTHSVNKKTHSVNLKSESKRCISEKKPKPITNNQYPITNNKNTCSLVSELPSPFDLFYSAYPRKQGKPNAQKAFKRINPNHTLVQKIIVDISSRLSQGAWDTDHKQFIPLPATYLNAQGWTDEIIPRHSAPSKPDYSAMAREAQELIL